jgi:hypothetical protein
MSIQVRSNWHHLQKKQVVFHSIMNDKERAFGIFGLEDTTIFPHVFL